MSFPEPGEFCGSRVSTSYPGGYLTTTIARRWPVQSSAVAYPPVYISGIDPEEGDVVQVDEDAVGDVIKRLRRAEGQIRGVIAMLESGRDCADVVTQLAAVSKALDRAGFKIIASGLQQCLTAAEDGEDQTVNLQRMEKLFLSLA